MRLAVVEPAPRGGLLHYALQLGNALASRGHCVDLIAARDNEVVDMVAGVTMRDVLSPLTPRKGPAGTRAPQWRHFAGRARLAARLGVSWARIVGQVRRGNYDAVILGCDIDKLPAVAGALVLTALSTRPFLVHICHNVRTFNRNGGLAMFSGSRVSSTLLRVLYPRFDLVVVHGERSRAEFMATWPRTSLQIIQHGDQRLISEEPPPPSSEQRVLLFGNWRKVKGLTILMEAFDELLCCCPEARLTVAGTPCPRDFDPRVLRTWAARHKGRVKLVEGYVPLKEVVELFADARVVVTPYLAGYQSGVIHLALTMARPVVTSDVGDLPAAVGGGLAGRIVPAGDVGALAKAVAGLITNASLAERLGSRGRRHMLAVASWDTYAETLERRLSGRPDRTL